MGLQKNASGGEVGAPRYPVANTRRVVPCGVHCVRIRVESIVPHGASQVHRLQVLQYQRLCWWLSRNNHAVLI